MFDFLRRKDRRARDVPPNPTPLGSHNSPPLERTTALPPAPALTSVEAAIIKPQHDGTLPDSDAQEKTQSFKFGASQPKKRNPQRVRCHARHELAVSKNTLTKDRRRSFKAPASAYPSPPCQINGNASHQRRPSTDKDVQVAVWPHIELANALNSDDMQLTNVSIRWVAIKAKDQNAKLKMIREGVAQSLIALLKHERATLEMRRWATTTISELSVAQECEAQLVAEGTVQILAWLINPLNNSDRLTLGSACRALRNLLCGSHSTAMLAAKYGCVDSLLSLIDGRSGRPEEEEVATEATAAVANLVSHGYKFKSYVIKHNGLLSLNVLGNKTENEELMFFIVNVLAHFAETEKWQLPIVAAGGLKTAFRALRMVNDDEVATEAARLVGNVAVTRKARNVVRDGGGITVLLDRLTKMQSFKDVMPAFDICNALQNVCVDPQAAMEALFTHDAADVLLRVYSDEHSPLCVVYDSRRLLRSLASGNDMCRARLLYSIGKKLSQETGTPLVRLYELRLVILDMQQLDGHNTAGAPESLERLSRASIRLINTGVTQLGRVAPLYYTQNQVRKSRQPVAKASKAHARCAALHQHKERAEISRTKNDRTKFRSTLRVFSVQMQTREQSLASVQQPTKLMQTLEDDKCSIPRAIEQMLAEDSEARASFLAKEADCGFEKEIFEVGQLLGKGGYGSVSLAKNLRTNELVAIKRFHQGVAMIQKALQEQRIWKGLHHRNVVEFKGSFVGDNGSLNLVVEYVNGLSLADHLTQYSAFPEILVSEIARQVLLGLEYLHTNGVTHRDLKPANILVDEKATVKICDFGVSCSENVQKLNPGQPHVVGTAWYIAPEIIEHRSYTTSVDIWSLGCTVLELATGRRPYHSLSALQVLFRMVDDQCPPIANNLSPDCKSFLRECWIWDPEARPSASALLQHEFIIKTRK